MREVALGGILIAVLSCATPSLAQTTHQEAHNASVETHEHAHAEGQAHDHYETDRETDSSATASDHIAPPPPQTPMMPMTNAQMIDAMQMDDTASIAMFKAKRFERAFSDDGASTDWEADAWIGGDIDKLWFRGEGDHADGGLESADVEAFWNHAVAPFWDTQLGVRQDFGRGTNRTWAAFGIQGLAPYWFDVELTAYVGSSGRTALRAEVDYEILLTQKLILQPRLEVNAYGKADRDAGIGAGVNDAELGVRLRYEVWKQFAPYVGVERVARFGSAAEVAHNEVAPARETCWIVGVRVWF